MFTFDLDLAKTVVNVLKLPFVADVNSYRGGRLLTVSLKPLLNETFSTETLELTIPRHAFTPEFVTQTYNTIIVEQLVRQQALAGGSQVNAAQLSATSPHKK